MMRCWTLHPDQHPWTSTNVVEEKYCYPVDRSHNSGVSVLVVRKRGKASNKNFMQTPPGLKDDNGFDKLSETFDVGGPEVLMPGKATGRGGTTERL